MGRNGIEVIAPRKCLLPQGHKLKEETDSVVMRLFRVLKESREALIVLLRGEYVIVEMSEEGDKCRIAIAALKISITHIPKPSIRVKKINTLYARFRPHVKSLYATSLSKISYKLFS